MALGGKGRDRKGGKRENIFGAMARAVRAAIPVTNAHADTFRNIQTIILISERETERLDTDTRIFRVHTYMDALSFSHHQTNSHTTQTSVSGTADKRGRLIAFSRKLDIKIFILQQNKKGRKPSMYIRMLVT